MILAKNKKSISNLLKDKTVLITGGSGSIGSEIAKRLLKFPIKSLRILDTDEYTLFKLKRQISDSRIRLLLGNILDEDRLNMAAKDVDIIIHTAAIKNIEISEFNPIETIDVNINGLVKLIKTIIKTKPKIFINISTDKAVEPTTLYGATKQIGERLTKWGGQHIRETKFGTVRLGNVFETRGNVFEIWKSETEKNKPISVTDTQMKRYFFHVDEAAEFIIKCITLVNKGETFVPKMKSYNLKELANKVSKTQKVVGIRQGEKLEEQLITHDEIVRAKELKDMWVIK